MTAVTTIVVVLRRHCFPRIWRLFTNIKGHRQVTLVASITAGPAGIVPRKVLTPLDVESSTAFGSDA